MNKRTVIRSFLLGLCMMLLLCVTAVPSAYADADTVTTDPGLKIAYKNIDLDSSVRIALAIDKSAVQAYHSVDVVVTEESTGAPVELEMKENSSEPFVREYTIGGKVYSVYFTVGFAPKDFDKVINAHAVAKDENGNTVAVGESLRYSVVEYILRQQKKNTDPVRTELYAALLEYHEYSQKVLYADREGWSYTPNVLVYASVAGKSTVVGAYKPGDVAVLTAVPENDGKAFSYWADADGIRLPGSSSNSLTATVEVTGEETYYAVYGAAILSTPDSETGSGSYSGMSEGRATGKLYLAGANTSKNVLTSPNNKTTARPENTASETSNALNNSQSIVTDGAKRVYISFDFRVLLEDIGTPNEGLEGNIDANGYYLVSTDPNGKYGELYGDLLASKGNDNMHHCYIKLADSSAAEPAFSNVAIFDYLLVDADADNVADGFFLRIANGTTGNFTYEDFDATVLPIDLVNSITYVMNVSEDGAITGVELYANGSLVGSADATYLVSSEWAGDLIQISHVGQSRFIGTTEFDNFSVYTEYYGE